MPVDMSLVDFDLQVLTTCGSKATVVSVPAIIPKSVIPFIIIVYHLQDCSGVQLTLMGDAV